MKKLTVLIAFVVLFASCSSQKEILYLLVGSYSDGTTPGISIYMFDMQTGNYEYVSDLKDIFNPSYLAVSPDKKFVYSVNETGDGYVSSFAFDKTNGNMHFINRQPVEGGDPCYININGEQTALITANYSGGNISVLPLNSKGNIEELTQNITFSPQSHIHTVVFSPDEKYIYATDLGRDCIYTFKALKNENHFYLKQDTANITRLETGSGPRHLTFHPVKNMIYCINELSGKITVFTCNESSLSAVQSINSDTTSGEGLKGSADIHLSPDGKFLYASNRLKADGIAIFSVNPNDGLLTSAGYQATGIHPRNFIISPDGKYLLCANRDSNNIQIFEIDSDTGLLHDTGKSIELPRPVCLKWIN
ncbi:MAG: lactonase family protein [Dysgonamonadaceae bacterium]|nr:lactonase family protein [Dysgonamonadaceae bacterium]